MRNSTQVLVKLYEEEENKYQVDYKEGVLQNLDRPLNPNIQQIEKTRKTQRKTMAADDESVDVGSRVTLPKMPTPGIGEQINSDSQPLTATALAAKKGLSKLKDALQASEADSEVGAEAYLIRMLRQKTHMLDLRGTIFAILYRTGFDRNELTSHEKQRIEMIQIYPQMRIGEIWTDIKAELEGAGIKPTSEDLHWMLTNIEEFQELVHKCVNTQKLIARENRKKQEDDLNKFFDIIRSNKAK